MTIATPVSPAIRTLDDAHSDLTFAQWSHRLTDPALPARALGRYGEAATCQWLRERSWHILDVNWRTRYGEIDIIALTPHRTIVEAVHPAKQMNLRRAATQWLTQQTPKVPHIGIRFDVMAVQVHCDEVHMHHIPEAF